MRTILAHLALPDCKPVLREEYCSGLFPQCSTWAVWSFPCQLEVADELVASGITNSLGRVLHQVHRAHHEHIGAGERLPWTLIETLEVTQNSEKITVSCDCPGSKVEVAEVRDAR